MNKLLLIAAVTALVVSAEVDLWLRRRPANIGRAESATARAPEEQDGDDCLCVE